MYVFRYKHEIRKEDKEGLRKLIKTQYHYQVTPEITRELDASRYAVFCCNCSGCNASVQTVPCVRQWHKFFVKPCVKTLRIDMYLVNVCLTML